MAQQQPNPYGSYQAYPPQAATGYPQPPGGMPYAPSPTPMYPDQQPMYPMQQQGGGAMPQYPPVQPYPPQQQGGAPPKTEPTPGAPPQYGSQQVFVEQPQGTGGRFAPPKGPQDLWAAILFIVHLGAFIALAAISIPKIDFATMSLKSGATPFSGRAPASRSPQGGGIGLSKSAISAMVIGVVAAGVLSLCYLLAMRRFPKKLIKFTFFFAIAYYIAAAVLSFVLTKNIATAIVSLVIVLIFALCYRAYRERMPFASVMLATVADVTMKYGGTVWTGIFGLVLGLGYLIFWAVSIIAFYLYFGNPTTTTSPSTGQTRTTVNGTLYPIYVFSLLSWYWTSQVISNVVHVTVAGVFASFYFLSGSPTGMPSSPTWGAFKRATTTSFGSICFGSLIIALIQTTRAVLRQIAQDSDSAVGAFLACCIECLLAWIEGLVEYFNFYAFTQVAIYGKPFCRAGKDTWTMIKDRGVDAIINDSLIGNVLFFGALLVAGINVLIAWIVFAVGSAIESSATSGGALALVLICAALMGIVVFMLVASVIESGTATTFVCLAEDPQALRATKPALWDQIRATYPEAAFVNMYA
ncbi:putative choline transporter, neither null mutation nor overexpression affects choline transport [Allomyces javanicus]|nr:putative choline transporter, neither null mutation nor overexpression affects choline transport [Allomyces javanicus]